MADGGLKIELDGRLADGLKAAAAPKGVPVEQFVREVLAEQLFSDVEWSDDADSAIDVEIAQHAIRTGSAIPWSDLRPWVESWGKPGELPPPRWRRWSLRREPRLT